MKLKFIIFCCGLLASLLVGCNSNRSVPASAAELVRDVPLLTLQEQTVQDAIPATGTVRAARTAQLSAQVMGTITAVNVREGDVVEPGRDLVLIDDIQARAGVNRAEAAYSAVGHELIASESDLALSQATFNRLQTLFEKKSLSAQEFDEIKARLQSATARRDMAVSNRAQAAAVLDQARETLAQTRVRAPFAGIVTERRVDPGALATQGMSLLTLESRGHYRLEANVDERDLKYASLGKIVPVTIDADGGPALQGRVIQVLPTADPASRSFLVKIDLPDNKNLRSGLSGHALFGSGERRALFVPQTAIMERGQLQSVYVIGEHDLAAVRYVTLAREGQTQREVLAGLAPGEKIIVSPAGRDLAGKRIEVR